jgi:hypothetical protein
MENNKDLSNEELELTDEMLERNDEIDNAVFQCICTLTEKNLDWDMEKIAAVTDAIKGVLAAYRLRVRHPGVVTNNDGQSELF